MNDGKEDARSAKQPNSIGCFACGLENPYGLQLEFFDNGVDQVSCTYTVPERFNGYPGVAHGGIVAAMMDEVVIRTAMIADPNRFMMTATMELKYRRPVPTGIVLHLTGRMVNDRGRYARAEGELRLPDGTVAVEAAMMMAELPPEHRVDAAMMDQLGWKVY
jgi:acyl-coenzyme A thioesterase PaaI-like protein